MEIRVITDITTEPVLLAAAKNHIKGSYGIDATEDALINSMIKAARQECEKYCDRTLASKVIEVFYHYDEVRGHRVRLPAGPHSVLTSVHKVDREGTQTELTLNTDFYKRGRVFWELELWSSGVNPWSDDSMLADDYLVKLTAGYGITGDNATEPLPEGYVMAILKTVGEWYLMREDYRPNLSSSVKEILNRLTGNTYL